MGSKIPVRNPVKVSVKRPVSSGVRTARSGGKKLDEFLGGGFPLRSNILVQGAPFGGKDVLYSQFIAEGIKSGIPSIVILTQYTTSQLRKRIVEMDYQIKEHERKGLISYVDCYSKTAGLIGKNPFAIYINGVGDLSALGGAIDRFQEGYKGRYYYHRLIFDSVTTLMRTHGLNPTYNLIHSISAKSKAQNGVSLFDLSLGVHSESDIKALENIMDATVAMKENRDSLFLTLRGFPNLKSKEWIEYSFDARGFDIKGIFNYDYIR